MSAWMCCDAHFDALLTYALVHGGVEFSNPATNHTAITAAKAILDGIEAMLVRRLGGKDPRADKAGWEAAPWGIDDHTFTEAELARRASRMGYA